MTTLLSVAESAMGSAVQARIIGMDVPRSMPILTGTLAGGRAELFGADGGLGAHIQEAWGWATSRTDNYPPTLSGQFPDSTGTPWAWRIYPSGASFIRPVSLVSSKVYTGTAAVKTITSEFLVPTTMTPTKREVWITIEYIDDATGLPKHINSRDPAGAALTTSTASWSFSTWGLVSFNKRKIALTTPTSIKQNTPINVTWWCAAQSASVNDILFLDHDFSVA
jgi:hypothetical protein